MIHDTIINMQSFTYRVIIEPDETGYHGYVPSLPGCHTCGDTVEETKKNLKDAIKLYIECLSEEGMKIPKEKSFESFETVEIEPSYA